ncbi:MAG: S8 family serine peptidase [Burkholderiales bacterium]|nr:S8 family serine peptidase [Burkholderiales bacterium]
MDTKRRLHCSLLRAAGALAALLGALPASAQTVDNGPARGLIVRLKDPVAHDSLEARRGSPRQREALAAAGAREGQRWQRVIDETGLGGRSGKREPRLRPVGRDQQLLDFERPLSAEETTSLREKLMSRPDVEWVEPNQRQRRLQATPTDPLFPQQWWLQPVSGGNANAIGARLRGVSGFQPAWLLANHAPTVVAVLDTGITSHPDLSGRVLGGYDFVSVIEYANDGNGRDNDPSDPGDYVTRADLADPVFSGCGVEASSWHGTIVAGMVAAHADNGLGGAGMHWGANILPVRVAGKCGAEVPDIVDGMRWAAGLAVAGAPVNLNPARIINISFGGSAACGPAYQAAVDELAALGVVVVAAAGNEWSRPSRPANCNGVVGVVGLNRDGFKTHYSNFGGNLGNSGIAAVAGDDEQGAWGSVLADSGLVTLTNQGSTVPGAPGYARLYGTSFAAPQVAATLAHMLSLNPALNHAQLLQGLRVSARPHVTSPKIGLCSDENPGRCICTTGTCGAGILDTEQALRYATLGAAYVPPVQQPAVIDNAEVDAALVLAAQDRPPNVVLVTGSSGGGAFGVFWLMALATAAGTLPLLRTRPQRGQG